MHGAIMPMNVNMLHVRHRLSLSLSLKSFHNFNAQFTSRAFAVHDQLVLQLLQRTSLVVALMNCDMCVCIIYDDFASFKFRRSWWLLYFSEWISRFTRYPRSLEYSFEIFPTVAASFIRAFILILYIAPRQLLQLPKAIYRDGEFQNGL